MLKALRNAVILSAIVFSSQSFADWVNMGGESAIVKADNADVLALATVSDNEVVVFREPSCSIVSDEILNITIVVNGQPIQASQACWDSESTIIGATTEKGRSFIYNEFLTKNEVIVDKWIFSAKGFSKAIKTAASLKGKSI
ncbi:hypothetical protein [Vibrio lentus]|uniref:hypothetical protein n=1 Tax=Vibrio lentus TaxID=136468 RepID=UPI001D04B1BA|nr:hypothetical protein [Vibrio lentus]MCB5464571.1 hypothetical protein [Vibrio lentus]MCC4796410.1 hypothetical protein [Vibrio lentus]MCC4849652.1 hypothetical protein [Vibrio lentus]